nr:MAG TPA: hypothetical protein [Caudoviricetes sp.]
MSSPIKVKINIYSIVAVIIQSVYFAVAVMYVFSFHHCFHTFPLVSNSWVRETL